MVKQLLGKPVILMQLSNKGCNLAVSKRILGFDLGQVRMYIGVQFEG